MKSYSKILTVILLVTTVAFTAYNVNAKDKTYQIGDRGPAGGFIFYDKGNSSGGWRYLEAAPEDQSDAPWYNEKYKKIGTAGTAIGTGKSNTQKIIRAQGYGKYAAKICADYRGGGRSDWFLPSEVELSQIYVNLYKNRVCGFDSRIYWSSSENDAIYAWGQHFSDGGPDSFNKDGTYHVRAVRAF